VAEPPPEQDIVWPGEHGPPPVQLPKDVQVPSALHVRNWFPHVVPHGCEVGPLQLHVPDWHVTPEVQALPHTPQFALSVCRFTQVPLHELRPLLHAQVPQVHDWLHVAVAFALQPCVCVAPGAQPPPPLQVENAVHVPFALQVRVCVPVPQLPQAWVEEPGQLHLPDWQVTPEVHVLPHAPQLALSVCVLMHAPPHELKPVLHAHAPQAHAALHVAVEFAAQP
jgi:hypothetical protein